ncbi:MAG TPA: hypothetical protein VMF11_05900 [Candidatus Baltobacteraceae bacterium]|nr:hypothetical protein [Candidatus Baltobacteraceae bacterium]
MALRSRAAGFAAVFFALGVMLSAVPAGASLDAVVAPRVVVPNMPESDCVTRAENALKTVMQNEVEAGEGSGVFVGVTRTDPSSPASAAAVIECHTVDAGGYSASFTCAVQTPTNPEGAAALCTRLVTAFGPAPAATSGGAL